MTAAQNEPTFTLVERPGGPCSVEIAWADRVDRPSITFENAKEAQQWLARDALAWVRRFERSWPRKTA